MRLVFPLFSENNTTDEKIWHRYLVANCEETAARMDESREEFPHLWMTLTLLINLKGIFCESNIVSTSITMPLVLAQMELLGL
jgi:hypothetical protein